jgi:hypothetical protein
MKKHFTILVLVLLHVMPVLAQLTYQHLLVDYDNAWTFKNLRVIPVRPKGLPGSMGSREFSNLVSFEQAFKTGLITVQERGTGSTENVHWLSLINNSDKAVYVTSGEIVKGGRQDRMVTKDTIIGPKSGRIDLPVMCVEEGRWSEKNKPFYYQGMANTRLRKVLDVTRNQVLIWKDIDSQLQEDSIKSKTLGYLDRITDKDVSAIQSSYLNFFKQRLLESDSNIVGVICVSGDKVLGADIFSNPDLFLGHFNPLLLGYIDQAITSGAPPRIADTVLHHYADQLLSNESSQEEFLLKNGKRFFYKKKLVHITSY